MAIYCYAVTNLLSGLGVAAFTWSSGANDATRSRLVDGRMAEIYNNDGGGGAGSGLSVNIDLGAAVALSGFAILNGNAAVQKTDAAVKVDSSDDGSFGVGHIDHVKTATTLNPAAPYNKDHVLQFPLSTARRYWRLTWSFSGGVTNFQVGELFAFASQVQLSRRAIYGDGETRNFKTVDVDFDNGNTRSYLKGGPIRGLSLPYTDLSRTQLEELYTLKAAVSGGARPFLWINSYEATAVAAAVAEQEVIYGKISAPEFSFTWPDFELAQPNDVTIQSLGREIGA